MIQQKQIKQLYDQSNVLTLGHWRYRQQVKRYVWGALLDDARKDPTSKVFTTRGQKIEAVIIAKQPAILAGLEEITWLLYKLGIEVAIKKSVADGKGIKAGTTIATLRGDARTILESERTVINTLQRMSGVATLTAEAVDAAGKKVLVAATRKTLWGWLDKKAVALGGGYTHRLHLGDGIMVKDNHWQVGEMIAIEPANVDWISKKPRWIEVDSLKQLRYVVEQGLQFDAILLDNFSTTELKRLITWMKKNKFYGQYILEVSGGITTENIKQYSKLGVDVISMSQLTMSAPAVDISLDIL